MYKYSFNFILCIVYFILYTLTGINVYFYGKSKISYFYIFVYLYICKFQQVQKYERLPNKVSRYQIYDY